MKLPELPLIDGCFLIDNSTLETLTTCPRALQYSKLNRRIAAGAKPSLTFGSALHNALEYRYKTAGNGILNDDQKAAQMQVIADYFAENPAAEDDYRNANWAIELVKKYNAIYPTEPFNVLVDDKGQTLCELSFALPLFNYTHNGTTIPVIYMGRIDLPVQWDGGIWILDHKTTSVLGPTYFEAATMSAQFLGYLWAFQTLTKKACQGFIINALRVKQPPAKPKDGLDSWWRESFQRQRYHVTEAQITEWKANTIALVKEFFWHYENAYFPMKTSWCVGKYGKCQYFDICSLPEGNRDTMLTSTLYQDNTWSPLNKNKTTNNTTTV